MTFITDPAMPRTAPFSYDPANVEHYDAAAAAACSCQSSPSTQHVDDQPDPDAARARWLVDQATLCARLARQELADQNESYAQYRARLSGNNGGPSPAQFAAAAAAQSAKQDFAVARTNSSAADPDRARKQWLERMNLQGAQHADKI